MMKKIGFLVPHLQDGGLARVLQMLTLGLSNQYEVYVILLLGNRPINMPIKGNVIKLCEEGNGFFGKAITFLKRIKLVKKLKKDYDFDIVFSFGPSANSVNILTKSSEIVIISEHNVPSIEHKIQGTSGKVYESMMYLYKYADLIVAVSEHIRDDLVENYHLDKKKISVIYNGLDIDYINMLSEKSVDISFMEDKINIICVSALVPQKGLWHIIRIMPLLIKYNPNIQLILVGKGEQEKCLKKLVHALALDEYVIFLGYQSNPFPYVKKSQVFVFPSVHEGFGMAFLEAMCLKVPVVASDCKSGPREVLADNADYSNTLTDGWYAPYGILCPNMWLDGVDKNDDLTENEMIFYETLKRLLSDKSLLKRYSAEGYKRCLDYSNKKMVEMYEKVFLSFLCG